MMRSMTTHVDTPSFPGSHFEGESCRAELCSNAPQLPPEILIRILEMATRGPARDAPSLQSWTPFESHYSAEWEEECDRSLETKYTLALVSFQFRVLSTPFLYEHLRIRRGYEALLGTLQTSKACGMHLGRLVQRISITPMKVNGEGRLIYDIARQIIRHCPNVRHISRPRMFTNGEAEHIDDPVPIDDIVLRSLSRVDWHNSAGGCVSALSPSPRSIWTSKTLQILSIGPDNFPFVTGRQHQKTFVNLPRLHTLCLRSLNAFGDGQRAFSICLPSLKRLVLASPEAIYNIYDGSLNSLHHQITHLEIGTDLRFLRHDFVSTLMHYFRYTADLYFPIFTTRPVRHNDPFWRNNVSFRVQRVYLSAALPSDEYSHDDQSWWIMFDSHIDGLCNGSSRFSRLKAIIFCGEEWIGCLADSRVAHSLRKLLDRRISISCNDPQAQRELRRVIEFMNSSVE